MVTERAAVSGIAANVFRHAVEDELREVGGPYATCRQFRHDDRLHLCIPPIQIQFANVPAAVEARLATDHAVGAGNRNRNRCKNSGGGAKGGVVGRSADLGPEAGALELIDILADAHVYAIQVKLGVPMRGEFWIRVMTLSLAGAQPS